MKIFYTAKNYAGKTKSGKLDVKDERDLAAQLRTDGYILTSFKKLKSADTSNKAKIDFLDMFTRVSLTEKLMFTRNLSVMVSSGLSLSKSVRNISLQTKQKKFASILEKIYEDIQAGNSFADGLAKYPSVFDDLFVNMVRVGEVSGNLEDVLNILALQLEKEHELMSKVKGALTYPAVIVVAMIAIAILMLTYILPKMMSVFTDMKVDLPPTTKFVIAISDALRHHGVAIALGALTLGIFLKFFLKTPSGKKTIGFLVIHIPVVKNIVIKVNCARFARIYSSLLKSGVSVVESLKIISQTLTNYYYQDAIRDGINKIQAGVALSTVTAENPNIFPLLLTQMIQVGEETGKTDTVLLKLAEFYEGEVSQVSKNMSSIIEPVLMILIGSAVGLFAVSMLQPMYSIMDNIK